MSADTSAALDASRPAGPVRRFFGSGVPQLLARLVLGGMFVWMGLAKAFDPVDFMKLIREYQMVPERAWFALNLMSAVLPWVEVLCGLLLIGGVAVRGSALLLALMLIGFTVVVTLRALDIYHAGGVSFCSIAFDCGCGAGVVKICYKLPENVVLFLLSVWTLFSRQTRFCIQRDAVRPR